MVAGVFSIFIRIWAFPLVGTWHAVSLQGVGSHYGLGRSASGCHGPNPFVETQRRCVSTKGGSGQHRAPARPPVLPNAKNKTTILGQLSGLLSTSNFYLLTFSR